MRQAIQGCGVEVDMAFAVKQWLDQTYGNYWTVIIGNAYEHVFRFEPGPKPKQCEDTKKQIIN